MRIVVLIIAMVFAQSSFGAQNINFGNVNENSVKKDTAFFTISGVNAKSFWVYFKLMEQKPYAGVKLLLDSVKTDTGRDIKIAVPMEFSPKQNMKYNGLLTIENKNSVIETVTLTGQGVFSNSYYIATQNKSAEDLKTALKTITGTGYKSLGYTSARDYMYATLDNDASGFVECVYTGKKAKFNTRSGANAAGFNTEHTFPQGQFNKNEPMRSDIHHLFSTTATSNSRRGNYPFGMVSSPSWQDGGSKQGAGKFEPRDAQKGRTARAMAYFVLRYQDYNNFYVSQEAILRQWMVSFPPTQVDIDRNNGVFSRQKNRNPFVDYPQFLDRISSISGTATDAKITSLEWSKSLRHQSGDTFNFGVDKWVHYLYNSGNQNIDINSVKMTGFSQILTGSGKTTLKPGESLKIEVELMSGTVDGGWLIVKDSIIIETNMAGNSRLSFLQSAYFDSGSGLSEFNSVTPLKIFPNPVLNYLYLELDENDFSKSLSIINLQGKVLITQNIYLEQVDVSGLPAGEYIIQLKNEKGEMKISRFLKQ